MIAESPAIGSPLIEVRNVSIDVGGVRRVDQVSFSIAPGECVAIVGESGAGKSLTALSLIGLLPQGSTVSAERFSVAGVDVRRFGEREWRTVRGRTVGFISQDALVALDPIRSVGREIAEAIEVHESGLPRREVDDRVLKLLVDVAVPLPERRARQLPGELSGGLRQRALIASALAAGPSILVADEPTTALDATVQARVLELLGDIKRSGRAIFLVSHDLGVVARLADRIAVMRDGVILEYGETSRVLSAPQHSYTRALLDARPTARRDHKPRGDVVLEARSLTRTFVLRGAEPTSTVAVRDVSFSVSAGNTLGIVGESGSGKSTVARMLVGIETPDAGEVLLEGNQFSSLSSARKRPLRSRIQLIDQDSFATFDPRFTVGRSIVEALAVSGVPKSQRKARVVAALEQVGLDPELAGRRRHELSGGQRQRIAIARALVREPSVLVCDEPVSALDVSVQAGILTLLARLQNELGLAVVFISHDLAVISAVCDDILVMKDGVIVEAGSAAEVLDNARHPFTRELISAFEDLTTE